MRSIGIAAAVSALALGGAEAAEWRFNNNYAPVTIAPDGTAYVGVLGGLVALE